MLSFIFPLSQGDNTKGSPKEEQHWKPKNLQTKSRIKLHGQVTKQQERHQHHSHNSITTPTATTTTTTAATPTTLLQHNASKSQQLTQQLPDSSWRMIQFTYKCQRCNNLQLASCNKKRSAIYGKNKDLWCSILIQHNILRFQILGHWWMSKEKHFFFQIPRRLGQEINCWDKKTPEGTREN